MVFLYKGSLNPPAISKILFRFDEAGYAPGDFTLPKISTFVSTSPIANTFKMVPLVILIFFESFKLIFILILALSSEVRSVNGVIISNTAEELAFSEKPPV